MNRPIVKMFLALGCAGMLAATASAQLPTTYTQGDFLLGFRQVGGSTNSVVVDIGQIANFTIAQTFTVNLGTTLNAQYGAAWQSNANVYFSLASTSSTDRTNYVTSPQYLAGPNAGPATIWPRLNTTNSGILQNKIGALGAEFTSAGVLEPKTDANAYANFMPGGSTDGGHATAANIAWGFFNPTTEGNLGQTTSGIALDVIRLTPGSGPGTDLGTFVLSADGNTLTFAPAVVPEPSTYAAVAVCGALALFGFRMNKARKSSYQEQLA